jgi:hypothetical protein
MIPNLIRLEISSNDFCTLPSDLSGFKLLEDLNLSSNNFSSDSVLVSPGKLFFALSTIPKLKRLNLSRNKLRRFHQEDLPEENIQLAEEEADYVEMLPRRKTEGGRVEAHGEDIMMVTTGGAGEDGVLDSSLEKRPKSGE